MKKQRRYSLRKLWEELRRRHVVRVAIYYAAFAWIVIQVGDVMLDAFDLSHWLRFVVAAVVAAFPIVLVLSWMFDITPAGVERTAPAAEPADAPPGSLAVLPFANLSEDAENEYFSDGLSEEIRNQLAAVPGLRVAARTSSFSFKGRHEDVREIGRLLNVASVLEGGVRKYKDAVRINLQLVSASDGYQIWSKNFERKLQDIFRLQSEIAEAVTQIVSPLTRGERISLPVPATESFDAYNLYLRGRHHFHRRTEAALNRAVEYFEEAIERDPDFALAYAGLGDAHVLLCTRYYGDASVEQSVSKALPAANRALEISPGLPEAHATLGLIRENQGDLDAAERSLRRALDLNPAYTMALVWYGLVLVGQGKFRAAEECNAEALQHDPLSPIVNVNVGFDALRRGEWNKAKAHFAAATEIDPEFPVPYYGLSRVHALAKEFEPALAAIDRAIECAPARAYYRARKGLLLLQIDRIDEATKAIEDACCRSPDNPFDSDLVIALYMMHQDRDSLRQMAEGKTRREYTPAQRGQAFIALGDFTAAREQYDASVLDRKRELIKLTTVDWIWHLPHLVNRAHLWLLTGDERGKFELEQFLEDLSAFAEQGIVNPLATYWAACAHGLLGNANQAQKFLREAGQAGWYHRWWEQRDWNFNSLANGAAGRS